QRERCRRKSRAGRPRGRACRSPSRTPVILDWMRTPRAEPRHALILALVAVAATAVLLTTGGKGASQSLAPATSAAGWRGLVGSRPRVALGQRVIVVLKTPSLAERVAAAGGLVRTESERGWTKAVLSAERLLVSRLALNGVVVHPDY